MRQAMLPDTSSHIDSAAEWMVRLTSGTASEQDRQAFVRWQSADPAHASAWQALQAAVDGPFAALASAAPTGSGATRALRIALLRPAPSSPSRRRVLKGGAALCVAGVCGYSLRYLDDALETDVAQRHAFDLADRSHLLLDARSTVRVRYSDDVRLVELSQGQLIATVARDATRPFVVQTRHGSVRALGTQFLVRLEKERTLVAVLEHSVQLTQPDGQSLTLHTGQVAALGPVQIQPLAESAHAHAAWKDGLLEVRNARLGDVIDALRPYHKGWIRVSEEAAGLPVFGVFPLDRSEDALRALHETLPIRQRRFGPWLTLIDHA